MFVRLRSAVLGVAVLGLITCTACQGTDPRSPAAGVMAASEAAPTPAIDDAWSQAREILTAEIVLYKPMYVPARFGPPELLEARVDPTYGPMYTIVYHAPEENLVFILNMGKGAFGNFSPTETEESIRVLGTEGTLSSSTETHVVGASWQAPTGAYSINAFSTRFTAEEMKHVVEKLMVY